MRIISIIIILLPFLSYSQINQTDANGLRQGLWQKQQPNGKLMYKGYFKDNKPVGEWKRYHPGGQVKAIIEYQENSDSAFAQLFDAYNKKVAEGVYIKEKKEGIWVYFTNDGKVAEEQYKNGLKNGISKKFYESGELMEEVEWVNGQQEGDYEFYFKAGEPYLQCKMKQGQRHGLCLIQSLDGKPEMEAHYKNNFRDGAWKFYGENGEFQYQLNYKEGELLNPYVRDSIANIKMQNLEAGKGKITDPEKFMSDPTGYMERTGIIK
jgi:antitoxin component YwqK of YwqJK toxin-antitoxin module